MSSFGSEDSSNLHSYDDVDTGQRAHHHTLGIGPTQAYPGNKGAGLDARASSLETRTTGLETRATALEAINAGSRLTALETPNSAACSPGPGNFAGGTSGTPVAITGMTVNFTSRGVNDLYLIIASFDMQTAGSVACLPVGRALVDATIMFDVVFQPAVIGGRATVSQHLILSGISAGAHALNGQYWNAGGAGTTTVFTGSRLSIVRLN
jgi:hypothetical protein